jgi:predicted deacylase
MIRADSMTSRGSITFSHPVLTGVEHPCFEVHGASDGPRLTILGGIHGCEYSSIAAVIRVMNKLDPGALAGTVVAVPVVSMESFRRRSAFVVPADGKNLNRCFPGDPAGTYTDVLAHAIFEGLIAPSDFLVDLHGGDLVEALEPFALYDESDVAEESRRMAIAFGLPYVVREARGPGGLTGMTSTAASARGIPAVIAEAGGCGQLEERAVELLVEGVGNVLRRLEMLPGPATPPAAGMRHVSGNEWLRCRSQGWWEATVRAGDEVHGGDVLGRVRDLWGDELELVTAPADGVVLFLTTSAAVETDGLLLGLGTQLTPIEEAV